MANNVPFVIVKGHNENGDTVYFPKAANYGIVEIDDLCAEIAKASSLTRGDVKNTIESLIDDIQMFLKMGHLVRLPGIGLFGLSFKTEPSTTKEGADGNCIKTIKLRLRPDTKMRDTVSQFEVRAYDKKNLLNGMVADTSANNG